MNPITECPHCHSDWGVFTKSDLINVPINYNFDGSRAYNGEMYDNAEKIIDKATVYLLAIIVTPLKVMIL